MVEVIAGEKGKGKTKVLLEKVNADIKTAHGSIVYLDKSQKHMYELDKNVRLINVTEFPVETSEEFFGFLCGIVSQDHDLEKMYLDSFLTIANLSEDKLSYAMEKLDVISEKFGVVFVLSISKNEQDLPECVKAKITVAL